MGWSKTLAREVGRDGITADIVWSGRVATDRIKFLDKQKSLRENLLADEVKLKVRVASYSAATASHKNMMTWCVSLPVRARPTSPVQSLALMVGWSPGSDFSI